MGLTLIIWAVDPVLGQVITNGELRGKIIDAQTNESLPGGQVVLRGTNYGAAANLDGEYFIRSVP